MNLKLARNEAGDKDRDVLEGCEGGTHFREDFLHGSEVLIHALFLNGQSVVRLYFRADASRKYLKGNYWILDSLEVGGNAKLCEVGLPLQT